MDVESVARNRSPNGFTSVHVALAPSSATCTRRFWLPTSIQQPPSPRVPSTSGIGKVPGWAGRRACGQHTSECKNARMRGRRCPKALVSPEPERVCPKVCANRNKSRSCSSREEGWKRGWNAQNPLCFSQGSIQQSPTSLPFILLWTQKEVTCRTAEAPDASSRQRLPGVFTLGQSGSGALQCAPDGQECS